MTVFGQGNTIFADTLIVTVFGQENDTALLCKEVTVVFSHSVNCIQTSPSQVYSYSVRSLKDARSSLFCWDWELSVPHILGLNI